MCIVHCTVLDANLEACLLEMQNAQLERQLLAKIAEIFPGKGEISDISDVWEERNSYLSKENIDH